MKEWGSGARAIVNALVNDDYGHAFNVINVDGQIIFVDAQSNKSWVSGERESDLLRDPIQGSILTVLNRTDQTAVYRIPKDWVKQR